MRWSIEQGLNRTPEPRLPTPEQLAILADEVGRHDVGIAFFCEAYARVSSCRSIGFGMGPIWQTAIWEWCDRNQIYDLAMCNYVSDVIHAVDAETLRRNRR